MTTLAIEEFTESGLALIEHDPLTNKEFDEIRSFMTVWYSGNINDSKSKRHAGRPN